MRRPPSPVHASRKTWCAAVALLGLASSAGCGERVNCEKLCERTLACEVEFSAPDDPEGRLVDDGDRTELESCVLGCDASSLVTIESATCADNIEVGDPSSCQDEMLRCFDVDEDGQRR